MRDATDPNLAGAAQGSASAARERWGRRRGCQTAGISH